MVMVMVMVAVTEVVILKNHEIKKCPQLITKDLIIL
jgi:hypothetical protein